MRRLLPLVVTLLGAAVLAVGVALVYLPAGVIAAGLALVAAGVFVIDDGRPQ